MLTAEERRTILNTRCPWPSCKSVVGEDCCFMAGKRLMKLTTMEGGFHDARVQAALGRPGRVIMRDPETGHSRVVEPPPESQDREPVALAQLVPTRPAEGTTLERPW